MTGTKYSKHDRCNVHIRMWWQWACASMKGMHCNVNSSTQPGAEVACSFHGTDSYSYGFRNHTWRYCVDCANLTSCWCNTACASCPAGSTPSSRHVCQCLVRLPRQQQRPSHGQACSTHCYLCCACCTAGLRCGAATANTAVQVQGGPAAGPRPHSTARACALHCSSHAATEAAATAEAAAGAGAVQQGSTQQHRQAAARQDGKQGAGLLSASCSRSNSCSCPSRHYNSINRARWWSRGCSSREPYIDY
jgi:hypothetical protein